uniref:Uncharacterized protein n=1 Tax=Rhizophora mucronata TaxID=61149 RepID=A0A2P2JA55_RHIMU
MSFEFQCCEKICLTPSLLGTFPDLLMSWSAWSLSKFNLFWLIVMLKIVLTFERIICQFY